MIQFDCEECGNHFRVPDEFEGRAGRCKVCSAVIVVPGTDGVLPVDRSTPAWIDHFERIIGRSEQMRRQDESRFKALYGRYKELKQYAKALQKQEDQWSHVEARLTEAHDEIQLLSDSLDTARKAQGAAEADRDHFETIAAELHEALDAERQARNASEQALDAATAREKEVDDLNAECRRLRTESEAAQATASALREELRSVEATADPEGARARLMELHDEIETLRRQTEEERTARNMLASRIADMSACNARLEETLAAATADLDERHGALQAAESHAQRLQNDLDAERQDRAELRGRLKALEEEKERLYNAWSEAQAIRDEHEKALRSAAARIAKQEEGLRKAQTEQERLAEAAAAEAQLREERNSLKARLTEAQDEAEWLVDQVAEVNRALGASKEQQTTLEAENSALTETVNELRFHLQSLETRAAEWHDREDHIAQVRQERDDAMKRLEDAENQLDRMKSEYESVFQNSDSAESRAAQAALDAERHAEEANTLRAQLEAVETERETLETRIHQTEEQLAILENELERLRDASRRAEALANELATARAAREESAQAVEHIAAELATTSKTLGGIEEWANQIETQLSNITQERDAARAETEAAQQRISELEAAQVSPEAASYPHSDEDALIPELLDEADDEIIDVLMRFIKNDDAPSSEGPRF